MCRVSQARGCWYVGGRLCGPAVNDVMGARAATHASRSPEAIPLNFQQLGKLSCQDLATR